MSESPGWLPDELPFEGEWHDMADTFYARYVQDIVKGNLTYLGRRIAVRKHPLTEGKGSGFWHCISDGVIEDDRVPDPDRCRRIGWIRAIIENCDDDAVETWVETNRGQTDHLLWFREEYVVILSERGRAEDGGPDCYLLKSAYTTLRRRQREKKRLACDAAQKANAAPRGDGV